MRKKIAYLIDNPPFYSGGRYCAWELAHALAQVGHWVTVYTTRLPVFMDDFASHVPFPIKMVPRIEDVDISADLYLAAPTYPNIQAVKLGRKYGKPVFCWAFDPLPLIKRFIPEDYHWEKRYFAPMVSSLKDPGVDLLVLTELNKEVTSKWLGKPKEKIHVIPPSVNSCVLRKIAENEVRKEKVVVSLSRIVNRKKFDHNLFAFAKVAPEDWRLRIVTSTDFLPVVAMAKKMGIEKRVEIFHMRSDEEKFSLLLRSRVMLNASLYEGFGMWLAEGRACGMAAVCYDFPNFREMGFRRGVFFAQHGRKEALALALKRALRARPGFEDLFPFERMVKDARRVFDHA